MKLKTLLTTGTSLAAWTAAAHAGDFNGPAGDLKIALDAYVKQAGISIMYSGQAVKGIKSPGVQGSLPTEAALSHILRGTGFIAREEQGGGGILSHQRREETGPP